MYRQGIIYKGLFNFSNRCYKRTGYINWFLHARKKYHCLQWKVMERDLFLVSGMEIKNHRNSYCSNINHKNFCYALHSRRKAGCCFYLLWVCIPHTCWTIRPSTKLWDRTLADVVLELPFHWNWWLLQSFLWKQKLLLVECKPKVDFSIFFSFSSCQGTTICRTRIRRTTYYCFWIAKWVGKGKN